MHFLNIEIYTQVRYCQWYFLFSFGFVFCFFLKLICSTYLFITDLLVFQSGEDPRFFSLILPSNLQSLGMYGNIYCYIYILYHRQIASFLNEHIALSKSNYVFVTISFHCQCLLSVPYRPIEHGLSVKWSIAVRQFENKYYHHGRWNISNLVLISSTGFT